MITNLKNIFYYIRFYFYVYFTLKFSTYINNPVQKPGWNLAFQDDFHGSTYDKNKWDFHEHWGNRKENLYWIEENVSIEHNRLKLTSDLKKDDPLSNTAGMITTWKSLNQKYGYFETKVKVAPGGKLYWSAGWFENMEDWPPEIDMFETMDEDSHGISLTLHWRDKNGVHLQYGRHLRGIDFDLNYHIFAIDWNETRIKWHIDNVCVFELQENQWVNFGKRIELPKKPMYFILNTGAVLESHFTKDQVPKSMFCEYFRAYKK